MAIPKTKLYKCPFDDRKYLDKQALYDYMEKNFKDELHGLPAAQVYFNYNNKYPLTKGFGRSVMSGKPTPFNLVTERYERFADEQDREAYREYFKKNMRKVYGKETLLDEPDHQKKMLAGRRISGIYTWSTGDKSEYTGSYERKFLEYLDLYLNWTNVGDIMAPAPMVFPYNDPTDKHLRFHIPDFYISSLNLIVNIKSSENKHYRLRDLEIEKEQDNAILKSKFNYLKLYDKEFEDFVVIMNEIREKGPDVKVVKGI